MSIKRKLRELMFGSNNGEVLFYRLRKVREWYALKTLSDYEYVSKTYKERFGCDIDLVNPKTFQEKLNWLKLFYRDSDMPRCCDKYEIHSYLKEKGFSYLSNELLGVYDNARDIDYDKLPSRFVAKANHGSGWNIICKDKTTLDWPKTVKIMNSWLGLNLYVFGREWNYKDIKPKIVVEKYIDHEPLNDYKFMCFNGKPLYMQLNNDYNGTHYVDFYELSTWKHLPATYGPYNLSNRVLPRPENYDKMYELACELSKTFPFVRVDFYSFDDVVLLGELTFFPGGGMWPFNPRSEGKMIDLEIGKCLELPEPNHNLELLKTIRGEV